MKARGTSPAPPAVAADGRAALLAMLVDDDVIAILKKRLSAEQRAELVLELINPHRPLTTAERADLAGVSERAIRDRDARGD